MLDREPREKTQINTKYFGRLQREEVLNWMGALYRSEQEIAVVRFYFEQFQIQDADGVTTEPALTRDMIVILEDVGCRVSDAKKQTRLDNKNKREAIETPDDQRRSWGSVVIDIAATGLHPSMQRAEGIHSSEKYSCRDLKPSKEAKFTSAKAKDQQEAARYCLHCKLSKKCGEMAVEMGFTNAVYGGNTKPQLEAKIRERGRRKEPKKTKKKKKK